jgi:hypothetical protein
MLIVIMPGEFINEELQCVSSTEVKSWWPQI